MSPSNPTSQSECTIEEAYKWSKKERYIVTYNPTKGKVYALLKDQVKSDDVLKAAFHISMNNEEVDALCFPETPMDIEVEVAKSCKIVSATYGLFKDKDAQECLTDTFMVLFGYVYCNNDWKEMD